MFENIGKSILKFGLNISFLSTDTIILKDSGENLFLFISNLTNA